MYTFNSKTILSFFLLLFFCFASSTAQKQFEGQITIENTIPLSLNAVFTLKKDKAMVDTQSPIGKVTMIANKATGKKTTITESEGDTIAIIKNANDMQYRGLRGKYKNKRARVNNVTLKVTRETKKINGYKCYKVVASDSRFDGEAWITKKLDVDPFEYFPVLKQQQRVIPRVGKALQNSMEGFVMEMTLKNLKTKKVERMTVTIEKKKINDTAFEIDMENIEVYDEDGVRELMKKSKGNPAQMRKARTLIAQIRMQ